MIGSSSVSLSRCKMASASPSPSPAAGSTDVTLSITPQVDATNQETQAIEQATQDPAPEVVPKKKGKTRSKVWNDFVRLSEEQAQCKHSVKQDMGKLYDEYNNMYSNANAEEGTGSTSAAGVDDMKFWGRMKIKEIGLRDGWTAVF
ncbi:hypothetical protein C5167_020072 [Papaver somniferum]|uniref:Uncharacterized protein n=1 Tax=Papaver somniferum TaxID=3469 RepID=A0A4Y7IV65_PAPSO|nr:hypothetical protein C5167_020072 [Papaver somniferum]